MADVGFSTGCLCKTPVGIEQKIRVYRDAGATALEIMLFRPPEVRDLQVTPALEQLCASFNRVSLHAPPRDMHYGPNPLCEEVLDKIRHIRSKIDLHSIIVHPELVDDYDYLAASGLPIAIENMDRRKQIGIHPDYFRWLGRHYDFKYCMDLQHVWEHDPSMKLAEEFRDVMGERLAEMHVSGCTDFELHHPTYVAMNKDAIAKALALKIPVPKIMEGVLSHMPANSVKEELDFVRSYEQ